VAEITLHLPLAFDVAPVCAPGPDGRCSICSDEGIPGRILELHPDNMALVEMPDGPQAVAVDLVDDAKVGEWLLVHLGFAIARLDVNP